MDKSQNNKLESFYYYEPMNLGEIIDQTLDIFKRNFKDYAISCLIIMGPMFVLMIAFAILNIFSKSEDITIFLYILIPFTFVSVIASLFFMLVMIELTSDIYENKKVSFWQVFQSAFRKWWRFSFAVFLVSLVLILILGIIFLAYFGVTALTKNNALAIIFCIFPFALFMYFLFAYFLAPYVVVIEDLTPMEALKRSVELFRYSRNSALKIMLVPSLINGLTFAFTFTVSLIPFVGSLLVFLTYPLPIIAMTLVYYDIRIRHEGFDLLVQAENLAS